MKKRLVALVLAMVMAVSMALPAYAAEGDTIDKFKDPPNTAEHEDHEVQGDPDNPDIGVGFGQSDLQIEITEPAQPCEHDIKYTCNGDGTHDGTCSRCNVRIIHNQMCTDEDDNLKCDKCEGEVPCSKVNVTYKDNEDGKTHNKVCLGGGHAEHVLEENIPHHANDAGTQCIDCGAAIACEHPEDQREIRSNAKNAAGKLTHSIVCKACGVVLSTVECSDADNDGDLKCDTEGCTNEFPCKHEDKEWLASQTLTWVFDAGKTTDGKSWHKTTCPDPDCQAEGHEIWEECYSADKDCTCDKCENVAHTFKWLDDNNNKTHSYKCGVCGKSTGEPGYTVPDGHEATENHADGDGSGYCDLCGFEMSRSGKPIMVAEVPAVISISATQDGRVTIASNLAIKNHSKKALRVDAIQASTSGWYPQDIAGDFSTEGPFQLEVNGTKKDYYGFIGISLRGECLTKPSSTFNPDNWIIQPEDSLPLNMACRVSPQSEVRDTMTAGKIMFSLEWYNGSVTSAKDKGAGDQAKYNKGVGEEVYTITFEDAAEKHYTIKGSMEAVQTDQFARIPQLPDVVPESGYAFVGWQVKDTEYYKDTGDTTGKDITLVPVVRKVSAGTVTFSSEGLPTDSVIKVDGVEATTVKTGADGRIYKLATITGGDFDSGKVKLSYWETSDGHEVKPGTQLDGDQTLKAVLEYNVIDPGKLFDAIGQTFAGSIVVKAPSETDPAEGTDISSFGNGHIKLVKTADTVTISGTQVRLPDAPVSYYLDDQYVVEGLFAEFTNVTSITFESGLDWSNVESMENMFAGCPKLTKVEWGTPNISKVTNMSGLFSGCSSMNNKGVALITALDTSKVTDMSYMFESCGTLTYANLANLETDSVTTMAGMFYGCNKITDFDLTGLKTDKVTNMSYMFADTGAAQTFTGIENWNVGNVVNFVSMFEDSYYTMDLNLQNWSIRTEAATFNMFLGAENKTIVNLNTADATRLAEAGVLTYDGNKYTGVKRPTEPAS